MSKTPRRLHLRLTPDNPIFAIPDGQRTKRADEWLRLGAEIERLTALIDRLEGLAGGNQMISVDKKTTNNDMGAKEKLIKAFEDW